MQIGSFVLDAEGKQFSDIHYNDPGEAADSRSA
jgi:hypothetical protein